jgi:hypothetical protein
MISDRHARFACLVALALLLPCVAGAQTSSGVAQDADEPRATRIEAFAALDHATRKLDIDYGDGRIDFSAPLYAGLEVGLDLYPVAFFAPRSGAAGLHLGFRTAKHRLTTLTSVGDSDDRRDVDVPTRHDSTEWTLGYTWRPSTRFALAPAVSWTAVEYSLGQNALLSNSFYRGLDVAVGAHLLPIDGLRLAATIAVRPATSLGSTVAPFGDDASSLGIRGEFDARYRFGFGMFVGAAFGYLRYQTRWELEGSESATGTDGFVNLALSLGYCL